MLIHQRDGSFKIRVNVETICEHCTLRGIKMETKVIELKEMIEASVGIPSYLLQLFYLDECAMVDTKSLAFFHILPDAKLKARVWNTNRNLVIAAKNGVWKNVEEELKYDSKQPISLTTKHDLDRPLTALFIACFYGNDDVVEKLLELGIVNERKPLLSGKDALQVAATRDHARCVELLLRRKFRPYEWNHERSSLVNWELQDRIKITLERIETKRKIAKTRHYTRLTSSQKYDSSISTWYCGDYGQIYLCVILADDKTLEPVDCEVNKKPVFRP